MNKYQILFAASSVASQYKLHMITEAEVLVHKVQLLSIAQWRLPHAEFLTVAGQIEDVFEGVEA